MMASLMMMTSTRTRVTIISLSIDKGKIFLSLTFFHHFLILYILYCLQLQCYKNSVCLVLCLALQLQLIEFSKGGAAMHDSVVLDLCTCWDRIFQHFSNISQSCVDWFPLIIGVFDSRNLRKLRTCFPRYHNLPIPVILISCSVSDCIINNLIKD